MTKEEFYQEFNVLYNNINSNVVTGLSSYEISVFLTKGQEQLVKEYFNPLGNKYKQGYDDSAKRQIDFVNLTSYIEAPASAFPQTIDSRAIAFVLPQDLLFIINEKLKIVYTYKEGNTNKTLTKEAVILPITNSDYNRLMSKPFGEPLRKQAWRLLQNNQRNAAYVIPNIFYRLKDASFNTTYGVVLKSNISYLTGPVYTYKLKYIRKPRPIIVEPLVGEYQGLTIDGKVGNEPIYNGTSPCELNEEIHREIVQRAVEIAKGSYPADNTQIITQLGERSE
jgi:hypothetical protein|nr:MAG TPA: hypothetical protein [Crassvirales sp.]